VVLESQLDDVVGGLVGSDDGFLKLIKILEGIIPLFKVI
jgi:hypothetical protein